MDEKQLYLALHRKSGFEVVSQTASTNQIRVLGRIPQNRMPGWLPVSLALLLASESSPWNADISKQYFPRNRKLRFAWRIILQGENIAQHLPQIVGIIDKVPMMRTELKEVPIQRSSHRQSMGAKGARGIAGEGGVPAIVRQRMSG